jgi:DNA adenine methylase
MQRGGIMASGASLMKSGEAGRGLRSRWYPETLVARICALRELRERVTFQKADAFDVIAAHARNSRAAFFIDPPYTAGGKNAGRRLYAHNEVDHGALFAAMAAVRGTVMMSYDNAREVRTLAARHDFRVAEVPMKNTHHEVVRELLVMKP